MKIKGINKIKNYKSFKCFESNNLNFHEKLNLFFGENGNGKSSIVDIFKNLSNNKNFEKSPEKIHLKIDDKNYSFEGNSWNKNLHKNSFIFFDDEFIAKNIHTNKERSNQFEGQAQNSSKILIEIDEEAIKLKNLEEDKKKEKEFKQYEIKNFKKENKEILERDFDKFEDLFNNFEEDKLEEFEEKNLLDIKKKLKEKEELETNFKYSKKIMNLNLNKSIFEKKEINIIRLKEDLRKLLKFDIKEKTIINAQEGLVEYIKNNKDFFEDGFRLKELNLDSKCPFCLSENKSEEIQKLLNLKNNIFDHSYENQLKEFMNLKQKILEYLEKLSKINYSFNFFFDEIEKINSEIRINHLYNIEEKNQFKEFEFKFLDKLKSEISEINEKNNKDFTLNELFNSFESEIETLNKKIVDFNNVISSKESLIAKFREENSNEKIIENINIIKSDVESLNFEKEFIENFSQIKVFYEKKSKLERLNQDFKIIEEEYKSYKNDYKSYCGSRMFKQKCEIMTNYLKRFNLNFEISPTPTYGTHNTIPFTFEIIDTGTGLPRSLKEGLSNGETQILSISFFLTCLDSYGTNLKNKVIFFDDPVSSLDNSNLNNLIDILKEKFENFNQVFIFTHHLTFHKFLSKKFRLNEPKEFLILKNKFELGGSFYCNFGKSSFFNSLKRFNQESLEQTLEFNTYAYEMTVLKYGQYLRYEVENFIKNDLLSWNKSGDFSDIVNNLKKQTLDDEDIEDIKKIYQFCNWTTSHVDIHENCFLNRLKENIEKFIEIKEKYNPPFKQ